MTLWEWDPRRLLSGPTVFEGPQRGERGGGGSGAGDVWARMRIMSYEMAMMDRYLHLSSLELLSVRGKIKCFVKVNMLIM